MPNKNTTSSKAKDGRRFNTFPKGLVPPNKVHWDEDMDHVLKTKFTKGVALIEIADEIGVARATAKKRVVELNLERPKKADELILGPYIPKELRFAQYLADGNSTDAAGWKAGYASGNAVLQRLRSKLGWQAA